MQLSILYWGGVMVQSSQAFLMLLTVPLSILVMLLFVDTQNFDLVEGSYGFVIFLLSMMGSLLVLDWVMPKLVRWWV